MDQIKDREWLGHSEGSGNGAVLTIFDDLTWGVHYGCQIWGGDGVAILEVQGQEYLQTYTKISERLPGINRLTIYEMAGYIQLVIPMPEGDISFWATGNTPEKKTACGDIIICEE